MKYIGTYSNDADIATKAKVDAKQDKVLVDGILQGDGQGAISAAETQEVELVTLTKADVGLGNVDNTSDANKPISTATQTALNGKQAKITASGLLKGDGSGGVTAATAGTDYLKTAPVTSVNSKTGAVSLTASDVGALATSGGTMEAGSSIGFGSNYAINNTDLDIFEIVSDGGGMIRIVAGTGGGAIVGTTRSNNIVLNNRTTYITYVADPTSPFDAANKQYVDDAVSGISGLPAVTTADNGKILQVVNGAWALVSIPSANGGSF